MVSVLPLVYCAAALWAQPQPRASASDYAASATFGDRSLGAEFLAHSVPAPGGVLFAAGHLVVDVGMFAPPGKSGVSTVTNIAPEHFTLTHNGKKIPLLTDSAGSVAAAMRESPMNGGPHLEATGSINNSGVILGRRRQETGVPELDRRGRGEDIPRAPGQDQVRPPAGVPLNLQAELERAALQRCECKLPSGGLLYFPFAGKLKSIKSLVLHYSPDGDGKPPAVNLTLIP